MLHNLGLSKDTAGKATNAALREERQMFTRDGEKVEGFPSSIVPTLEEKTIMEHRPPGPEADDEPIADKLSEGTLSGSDGKSKKEDSSTDGSPSKGDSILQNRSNTEVTNETPEDPRVDEELLGAPANASISPQIDTQPPQAKPHVDDADEQERAAPRVRSVIRKQLTSKLGSKWTLPTPRPKVDPQAFDDPICDVFWKNVWVASAVHNVCAMFILVRLERH